MAEMAKDCDGIQWSLMTVWMFTFGSGRHLAWIRGGKKL